MNLLRRMLETLLPRPLYRALLAPYHFFFSLSAAVAAGFPARGITVIAVTGTKGKSSVTEMLARIFEKAGKKVATSSTIRFSIGSDEERNLYKMTLPGHGFIQAFLRRAADASCDIAIIEVTSEAALQSRHRFLSLDGLVFTNLQKEHLESHGGMENYFKAKYRIGTELARSQKRPRVIVANEDDEYGRRFLALPIEKRIPFSLSEAADVRPNGTGSSFRVDGVSVSLPQPGMMNILNALAAMKMARAFGVPYETSAAALAELTRIPGRAERIERGQDFAAIVDYAHTPESLSALYSAYPGRKICVLGNTGGGRDAWKRPEMGRIADEACTQVILTDEDPYDEDPEAILAAMAAGMKRAPKIILNRREAIRTALMLAQPGDTVLVSGKGTDPFIMRAKGAKEEWSDARVVTEELDKLLGTA